MSSSSKHLLTKAEKKDAKFQEEMQSRIQSLAMGEGIKSGLCGVLAGGAFVLGATLTSPNFSKFMSVSAKTSFPVMAGLGLFTYGYEISMHDAMRFPERWGLTEHAVLTKKVTNMPIHHRAANGLYDYPFTTVLTLAVPIAGFTLREQMKVGHISWSKKLMTTRVYAQGGILILVLSTMGFRDYMNKRGRFPEPDEDVVEVDEDEKKR